MLGLQELAFCWHLSIAGTDWKSESRRRREMSGFCLQQCGSCWGVLATAAGGMGVGWFLSPAVKAQAVSFQWSRTNSNGHEQTHAHGVYPGPSAISDSWVSILLFFLLFAPLLSSFSCSNTFVTNLLYNILSKIPTIVSFFLFFPFSFFLPSVLSGS